LKEPSYAAGSDDLKLAVTAAQAAGQIIAERFAAAATAAESKDGGKGEVTQTDLDAEAAVLDTLRSGSGYAVLSEEAGGGRDSGDGLWIIDPLDGTTNFSRGIPLFAVSIALMRERHVELGVIYHPVTGQTYWAERGRGAWCDGERLQVSEVVDPSLAVLYLTHGYPPPDRQRYGAALSRFAPTSYPRSMGSTAVELSWVAAGKGDAWACSGDELWDFTAGLVLIEEAGGRMTDWRGRDWDGESLFTAFSNGHLHDYVVGTIADLQPE
jgi:myo-inositol-1(or 4)-monophosphatase